MATRIIDDSKLQNIAVAIQGKDGGGTMTVDEMPTRIANIPSGGVEEKDVIFYDYEGTIVYSCTLEEAHNLTALPIPPQHEGLIFQEWNYTLAEVQAATHILDVGAIYDTHEIRTDVINGVETTYVAHPVRLYLDIPTDNFTIHTRFGVSYVGSSEGKENKALINWGDGTAESVSTTENVDFYGNYKDEHTYVKAGRYVLQIFCHPNNLILEDGEYVPIYKLFDVANTQSMLLQSQNEALLCYKIEIGSLYTKNSSQSKVWSFYNAKTVTLSNKTFIGTLWYGYYFLAGCKHVNIPKGVTVIPRGGFHNSCLKSFSFPNTITKLENGALGGLPALKRIIIPDSVTTLDSAYIVLAYYNCETFYISNGLTAYPSNMCYGFHIDELKKTADVNSFGSGCFRASTIKEFTFEEDVISTLSQTFYQCTYLQKVIFKGEVSSIDANCFRDCYSLLLVDLSNVTSVPTLSDSNAFNNVPSICQIKVPASLLEDFKIATNWSAQVDKLVGVS